MTFRKAIAVRKACLAGLIALAPAAAIAQGTLFKPEPTAAPATSPNGPRNAHAPKKKREQPTPAEPTKQSPAGHAPLQPISGEATALLDTATLVVNGHNVPLAGLSGTKASAEFASAALAFVQRHGSPVSCAPQGEAYACQTKDGVDIGSVLALNGVPCNSPGSQYYALFCMPSIRRKMASADPVLTRVVAGEITLQCQTSSGCGLPARTIESYFALHDWAGLAKAVVQIGVPSDQNYYYLGRAAMELGAYPAAVTYLERAKALHRDDWSDDGISDGGCSVEGPKPCGIAYDMRLTLARTRAAFLFQ